MHDRRSTTSATASASTTPPHSTLVTTYPYRALDHDRVLHAPLPVADIRPRVFISAPFTVGDQWVNVRRAINTADALVDIGCTPYIPLLNAFWHLVSPHTYDFWMAEDQGWLAVCGCVLRLPGESKGADQEEEVARSLGIAVCYSVDAVAEWASRTKAAAVTPNDQQP